MREQGEISALSIKKGEDRWIKNYWIFYKVKMKLLSLRKSLKKSPSSLVRAVSVMNFKARMEIPTDR